MTTKNEVMNGDPARELAGGEAEGPAVRARETNVRAGGAR